MRFIQQSRATARAILRRAFRYRGLMVIALWQAAPVHSVRDESGALRLRFGYGSGQYEDARFSCDGNFIDSDPVPFRTVGADVEVWPSSKVRISGSTGHIQLSPGDIQSADRYGAGIYSGALIALEGSGSGFGVGLMQVPSAYGGDLWPSAYLRLGRRERGHFRIDLMPPEMTLGNAGFARVGLGFNPVGPQAMSGLAGLALCYFCGEGLNMSGFLGLDLPLSRAVGIDLRGLWGPGHQHDNYGFSVAGRVTTNFKQGVQPRTNPAPTGPR